MPIFTPAISEVVTQDFIEQCCLAYKLDHSGYHGFYHWMRVLHNGRIIANLTGANIKVVELFCLLHDTKRKNDNQDPLHGHRAALHAQSSRGLLFKTTDAEMEQLIEACTYHSDGHTDGDITVQTCWDADRLDLGRVGIRPVPHRLCTEAARLPSILEAAYERSVGITG
ncbi:MAG: hypothetical protein QMB16_00855 [Paracoccaceae bacterium]|jgi:uncharacterized protein